MFEISWLELALYILAAYAWGRWVQWRLTIQRMAADPKRFVDILGRLDAIQQEEGQETVAVTVEWQGDQCYLYRKDTMEFIGQGASIEAAIQNSRILSGVEYLIPADMAKKPPAGQP